MYKRQGQAVGQGLGHILEGRIVLADLDCRAVRGEVAGWQGVYSTGSRHQLHSFEIMASRGMAPDTLLAPLAAVLLGNGMTFAFVYLSLIHI